jgi:uncharacterized protein
MKILIDLGHPAHIHYFKNFVWLMQEKGHNFCLVSRDKEVLHQLLNHYNLSYISRGKGGKSLFSKALYLLKADLIIYKAAKKFKPDLFLSFSSTYAAHVSRVFSKPHIVLDDTEHAKFELMMYPPFSDVILNPKPFWKKFSKKQLFFDSYMELSHLLPKYYTPDIEIIKRYGLSNNENYFIVRFVSWDASHDVGQTGLDLTTIVKKLEKYGRVLISSEAKLPVELEKYKVQINPAHLHQLLYFSSMYIGEGATTAAEAIILGTPAIYINTLDAGTISEQAEKYGLVSLRNAKDIMVKIDEFLSQQAKADAIKMRNKIINDKIDITSFLVWFVENYPESEKVMRKTPDYQYNFK